MTRPRHHPLASEHARSLADAHRCAVAAGQTLVVAYVEVVGLKSGHDGEGHPAGDELLGRVVGLIREHLRPDDHGMRLGGDEFLFAMPEMTLHEAQRRFAAVADALHRAPGAGAISVGLAELRDGEDAHELLARADADLIDLRRRR